MKTVFQLSGSDDLKRYVTYGAGGVIALASNTSFADATGKSTSGTTAKASNETAVKAAYKDGKDLVSTASVALVGLVAVIVGVGMVISLLRKA